jgi:hypothetical protein
MVSKPTGPDSSAAARKRTIPLLGQEPGEEIRNMQKDLLDLYEQAWRVWLTRMKLEGNLWSELTAKLSATSSGPEALESCRKYMEQRMQIAAEDGRQLFEGWKTVIR